MPKQEMENSNLHVVMFPFFAFGHISPFIQLSNKLSSHGIQISFLSTPGNIPRISNSLNVSLPHVSTVALEMPVVDGLPVGMENTAEMTPLMSELLKKALDLMQPQIKSLLAKLKPDFVFHDFAQEWLPAMASEVGVKSLFFSVFSALASAFYTVPARIGPSGEQPTLEDLKKPPQGFPSKFTKTFKTYQAKDALYLFMSFHGNPSVYDRVLTCMNTCTAIVIKTCKEIEGPYIDYIQSQFKKPVLLLGPVIPNPPSGDLEEKWAKWLAPFPKRSAIFCSFGSETFLGNDQINELLLGLELTGLPFFVVLNFEADGEKRLLAALPIGFEERVKGKGVVHTGWVQQQQILAHENVGCFVCHAGLSSITEALMNDCQLVLLPQKGDQFLNAKLVAEDMKAGVEVNTDDITGRFKKEDLCDAVKTIMVNGNDEPGKTIRMNNEKWKNFMLNKEVHEGFVGEFVKKLKEMAVENN